ncbi:MAG: hypothetical protein ABS36_12220 [Acidobacteria bacterium SCN 69-37]|nr:MAG: hypothetical protein ABS36_12220 [Acidobacteria bacterium SCN 69-37]
MFHARTVSWLVALLVCVSAWVYVLRVPSSPGTTQASGHVMDHSAHAAGPSPIITTAFDAAGVLYAVEASGSQVLLRTSSDKGRSFSDPVAVTPQPEALDANGEARPKVVIGRNGEVLVSWTRKGEALYTGDIRFARSIDGGRTFSAPVTVNDDGLPIGHRFDSLGVAPDGTVVLVWIDKRDLERATAANEAYAGAALYVATSLDGGATFSANRKLKDHSCECCRIAVAFDEDSAPVMFWRDVLPGGIRDHVVGRLTAEGTMAPVRVSRENWQIEACPHQGPALAISAAGRYHFAWFTGAESTGDAVFYAHSDDRGVTVSTPRRLDSGDLAGHPSLVLAGGRVWLAWKEWRDDNRTAVMVMSSADDGETWSTPREMADAPGTSDRPFLIAHADTAYLSWTDPVHGLRVVPVPAR